MCQLPVHMSGGATDKHSLCTILNRWDRKQQCVLLNTATMVFFFVFFSPLHPSLSILLRFLLLCSISSPFPPPSSSSPLLCLCVLFPFSPAPCEDRWCICLWKTEHLQWNWFSVEKLMDYFVGLTGVGDCLCHTDKYVYTHIGVHVHTHRHRHTGVRGQGDCLCRSRINFYELWIAVYGKIHF